MKIKRKERSTIVKKRAAAEINIEALIVEQVEDIADSTKSASKGTTTAQFVEFMNELLDVMDLEKKSKGSYIIMYNTSVYKFVLIFFELERILMNCSEFQRNKFA